MTPESIFSTCSNTFFSVLLLPIQTSPKHPWPSLSSSRKDSRGISQASLASPWVWGLTVGHTVVSLWQRPSACSAIKRNQTDTLHPAGSHTHPRVFEPAGYSVLNPLSCIVSFHLMWMNLYPYTKTVMKYKWDEMKWLFKTPNPLQTQTEMKWDRIFLTSTLLGLKTTREAWNQNRTINCY